MTANTTMYNDHDKSKNQESIFIARIIVIADHCLPICTLRSWAHNWLVFVHRRGGPMLSAGTGCNGTAWSPREARTGNVSFKSSVEDLLHLFRIYVDP